jgi:hypothetical protein
MFCLWVGTGRAGFFRAKLVVGRLFFGMLSFM